MITIDYVIEVLGGTRAAARTLGLPSSTLHSWKKNGVPSWRWPQIEGKLNELRVNAS